MTISYTSPSLVLLRHGPPPALSFFSFLSLPLPRQTPSTSIHHDTKVIVCPLHARHARHATFCVYCARPLPERNVLFTIFRPPAPCAVLLILACGHTPARNRLPFSKYCARLCAYAHDLLFISEIFLPSLHLLEFIYQWCRFMCVPPPCTPSIVHLKASASY